MIVVATILVLGWLSVLTLVVLALVRQTTAIQLALQQRAPESFSVDADGPVVGSSVPDAIVELLHDAGAGGSEERVGIVVFSATCGPCRDVVSSFDRAEIPTEIPLVAVVVGSGDPAVELVDLARQHFDVVVSGGDANLAADALGVHSSPFAVVLDAAVVRAKTYVRQPSDIYALIRPDAANRRIELQVSGGSS